MYLDRSLNAKGRPSGEEKNVDGAFTRLPTSLYADFSLVLVPV